MLNFINHYDFLGKLQHYDPHCMSDCLSQLVFCLSHKTYLKSYDLIQYLVYEKVQYGQYFLLSFAEKIILNPWQNEILVNKQNEIFFSNSTYILSKRKHKILHSLQNLHIDVKND